MQYSIRVRQTFPVPRAVVWSALTDLPRWPQWDPYIVSLCRQSADKAVEVAADPYGEWRGDGRWEERVQRGPFRPRFRLRVVECQPPVRLAWEARNAWVRGRHVWEIRDNPSGCEVLSTETFSGVALLIAPLRPLLALFRVWQMTRVSLQALAVYVARGGSDAPQ